MSDSKTPSDSELRQAVALFRYGLIADLVHRTPGTPGLYQRLQEKAAHAYTIPGTQRTRVAAETLRDWLRLYRTGGFDALLPKRRADRGEPRRLPPAVIERLLAIKESNLSLSVRLVIAQARASGDVPETLALPRSSVHRLLAAHGLMHKRLDQPTDLDRRRFAFERAGELWMSDVLHGPSVYGADRRKRKTYLIAFIDDATRVIPYAAFAGSENTQAFLPVLKQAILRRGFCERLYVDNGASYRSHHLALVCAKLGIALIHAGRPKDKAKAEVGVQVVERWILARLRHHSFFSLAELNQCIGGLLEELNARPFKQLPGNRRQAFEQIDRPALRPLPRHPYRYVDIKPVKVNIDYHVQYQRHHYSVPHHYVGKTLELHASDTLVVMYYRREPLASHPRKFRPGVTTVAAHMPERHHKHQQWTPGRLKNWARDLGAEVLAWVSTQLTTRDHPEQAYRVCLGLLSLSREYPAERLNAACRIANREGLLRLAQIKAILTSNRDRLPEQISFSNDVLAQDHENIRGAKDFH